MSICFFSFLYTGFLTVLGLDIRLQNMCIANVMGMVRSPSAS